MPRDAVSAAVPRRPGVRREVRRREVLRLQASPAPALRLRDGQAEGSAIHRPVHRQVAAPAPGRDL